MSFRWETAVTTVPSRVYTTLLPTLESLANGGFDQPRLFVDGHLDLVPRWFDQYRTHIHDQKVFAFGNWLLALHTMLIISPDCDFYAIFQDDVRSSKNVRQFVEASGFPEKKSYLNLVTYPVNHPGVDVPVNQGYEGWHLSNQRGKGAQALIFDREGVMALLSNEQFNRRCLDLSIDGRGRIRGRKNIDGGVCDCLVGQLGYKEYVHSPSMMSHLNDVPSVIGNPAQPKIGSWRGEGFDAMACLAK